MSHDVTITSSGNFMRRPITVVLAFTVLGCSAPESAEPPRSDSTREMACGRVETSYRVIAVYPDTSYAFGMDSTTLQTLGMLEEVPELDPSECRPSDMRVFYIIRREQAMTYYQTVTLDGRPPIDSLEMVSFANWWREHGHH